MARSWGEEACLHCKGYPGYDECTCTPLALAKRAERQRAAAACRGTEEKIVMRTTPWDGDEEVECVEGGYVCGSNYCDDPLCEMEHPELF